MRRYFPALDAVYDENRTIWEQGASWGIGWVRSALRRNTAPAVALRLGMTLVGVTASGVFSACWVWVVTYMAGGVAWSL